MISEWTIRARPKSQIWQESIGNVEFKTRKIKSKHGSPVSYLERAIFIQQNVCWFEVSMNDRKGMYIFQTNQHLVNKSLNVFCGKVLW